MIPMLMRSFAPRIRILLKAVPAVAATVVLVKSLLLICFIAVPFDQDIRPPEGGTPNFFNEGGTPNFFNEGGTPNFFNVLCLFDL
jgi:hypothetical protein